MQTNFIVLVAQVLLQFFDFMKPFEKVVPAHIKHWLAHFCMNNALTLSSHKEAAALLRKISLEVAEQYLTL